MRKLTKSIAAALITAALITSLAACNDENRIKFVTYDTVHKDLCNDANLEADKIIFYFLASEPDRIDFVLYDDDYPESYKLVNYKANSDLISQIRQDQDETPNHQQYPFSQTQLKLFDEIIEKYDPIEVTGPEFNEMFLPWFEEIVNEHCK